MSTPNKLLLCDVIGYMLSPASSDCNLWCLVVDAQSWYSVWVQGRQMRGWSLATRRTECDSSSKSYSCLHMLANWWVRLVGVVWHQAHILIFSAYVCIFLVCITIRGSHSTFLLISKNMGLTLCNFGVPRVFQGGHSDEVYDRTHIVFFSILSCFLYQNHCHNAVVLHTTSKHGRWNRYHKCRRRTSYCCVM